MITAKQIQSVAVDSLGDRLGFDSPPPRPTAGKPLVDWKMNEDDGPIFRYLFRHHRPRRHLEFGTWQGHGTAMVLTECDATVWTINLPWGERTADQQPVYHVPVTEEQKVTAGSLLYQLENNTASFVTDAGWSIGQVYREMGLAHRVCQIYCDSRLWDASNYPAGFFDSVLIDGGHSPEVVISDTRKALPLVRPGGLVLWHDYCLDPAVPAQHAAPRGVCEAIDSIRDELAAELSQLFWIDPSWILVGVKR